MQEQNEQAYPLRQQLSGVRFPLSGIEREELKARVFIYVDEAKSRNWSPERVLIALKHFVNEAVPRSAAESVREALMVDVVGWCIERYYHARAD